MKGGIPTLSINSLLTTFPPIFLKISLFYVFFQKCMHSWLFWRKNPDYSHGLTKLTNKFRKKLIWIKTTFAWLLQKQSPVFCKKGALKNFAKFTGKHMYQSLFFNFIKKRDSGTCVFLWILRNFEEHLFLQNTSGGCFYF